VTPAPAIHVVRDGTIWLVVSIPVEGPGTVLGRWTDRAKAEQEACYWLELARSES
jgi:hypothetical protein